MLTWYLVSSRVVSHTFAGMLRSMHALQDPFLAQGLIRSLCGTRRSLPDGKQQAACGWPVRRAAEGGPKTIETTTAIWGIQSIRMTMLAAVQRMIVMVIREDKGRKRRLGVAAGNQKHV